MSRARTKTGMVDVTAKADTVREARAEAHVHVTSQTAQAILEGSLPKGNPLEVARIAGIMAAKNTPQVLPLCHPVPLTSAEVDVQLDPENARVDISSCVKSVGKTGVEMEALTAVSVAALTVYDMCKSRGHDITIQDIRLTFKSGGRSGVFQAPARHSGGAEE